MNSTKIEDNTSLTYDGGDPIVLPPEVGEETGQAIAPVEPPPVPAVDAATEFVHLPLESLAFGRSGDKGDKANIGVLARHPDFVPWIASSLTVERVAGFFAHFLDTRDGSVQRFYLPGSGAFNFLLHAVLGGGGVASLRADPQGKSYAQLLLTETVALPRTLAAQHGLLDDTQQETSA